MKRLIQVTIFAIILGCVKAHHFVKLVILAGLGLAGLWMVHTLAQDFSHIQSNGGGTGFSFGSIISNIASASGGASGGGGGAAKQEEEFKVYKRSINRQPTINWDFVLNRDPASCARSFICQLAAENDEDLNQEEKNILEIAKQSAESESWASKQISEALKNGQQFNSGNQCMKIYKFCPYSKNTMMTLLRVFGR